MMLNLPEFCSLQALGFGTETETELARQAGCLKKGLETSRRSRVLPDSTNALSSFLTCISKYCTILGIEYSRTKLEKTALELTV
jgi:hypothetical protein